MSDEPKRKSGFATLDKDRLHEIVMMGAAKGGRAKVSKGFGKMEKERLTELTRAAAYKSHAARKRNKELKLEQETQDANNL